MTVTEYIKNRELTDQHINFNSTFLDFNNRGLTSLEGIERFTNVDTLFCSGNSLKSLKGIENLRNLKRLKCAENELENLKGLENCTKLTFLSCWSNKLKDLEDIKKLKLLEEIICSGNKIESLEPLRNFQNLGGISCVNNLISDYSPLLDIPYLETFDDNGNPASHKYCGLNLNRMKAKIRIELHLKSNDDLRGAASISDTGLFDFKIK